MVGTKQLCLASFILLLQTSLVVWAQPNEESLFPKIGGGYLTDIAGVLTTKQKSEIQNWCYTVEKKKGVEIAVVTIDSIKDYPDTANESIENFTTALFNKYGIGDKTKGTGILLLVAVKDRQARIELGTSYGHTKDREVGDIMQNILIPKFKENDYSKGITLGVKAIIREFTGIVIIPGWVKVVIFVIVLLLISTIISLFRSGKNGWAWLCIGAVVALLLAAFVLFKDKVENFADDSTGGSFGGGSSGGGGATGKW